MQWRTRASQKREHNRADQHALAALKAEIQREHVAEDNKIPAVSLPTGPPSAQPTRNRCGTLGNVTEQNEQRLFAPIVRYAFVRPALPLP